MQIRYDVAEGRARQYMYTAMNKYLFIDQVG
jgi:hypothetical protein